MRRRTVGYYLSMLAIYVALVGVFMIPSPIYDLGANLLPNAMLFAGIALGPMFLCSLGLRSRPLFQSPYHGEKTAVMSEIWEEVSDTTSMDIEVPE
jgi:hypothetical protein